MARIKYVKAREIIDSRANPTIEVDLVLEGDYLGRFAVPSGASTGTHEALELRDGDSSRFLGKGVLKAVDNVNTLISQALKGKMFDTQEAIDSFLLSLDGTENKSKLGANAILGVSMAFASAMSKLLNLNLYEYIAREFGNKDVILPRPMFNIMNGGKHANWSTDIQEFMIIISSDSYREMLRAACEIFLTLEKLLKSLGKSINVGNEGGFAPGFNRNEEALDLIVQAVEKTGYKLGEQVFLALDIAASEFYIKEKNIYFLKTENLELSPFEWKSKIKQLLNSYPIISIEDPFAEDDLSSWVDFTQEYSDSLQIVGDDLLVTNKSRILKAVDTKACNALLVKLNQIGTLTETIDAMKISKDAGWRNIVSHRSGETEDLSIVHLAVGSGCGQIKTGAPSRGERTCKYNELLRLSESIQNTYNG
jgi:enolase